jgi:polar amino acid transport system ATP-binding protein
MAILEVKNLKKSFGSLNVLKGIDFSLEKGEVLSIIGSSGGGKTTLLRCLNFLEIADDGAITIDGEDVFSIADGIPHYPSNSGKYMGLVFQQFNLFPQYSVIDNLTLAPRLAAKKQPDYKQNKKQILEDINRRAEEILASTGLSAKKSSYPCQLSGGQQQRVAIARALMMSPVVLCFDEPTSALDPELTGEVLKVIRELKNADRTMIIVTHELAFARSVSDKVMFLSDGVIEEFGTPEEVFENPKSEKTKAFLGAMLSSDGSDVVK